jgi:hypothetical protein
MIAVTAFKRVAKKVEEVALVNVASVAKRLVAVALVEVLLVEVSPSKLPLVAEKLTV